MRRLGLWPAFGAAAAWLVVGLALWLLKQDAALGVRHRVRSRLQLQGLRLLQFRPRCYTATNCCARPSICSEWLFAQISESGLARYASCA